MLKLNVMVVVDERQRANLNTSHVKVKLKDGTATDTLKSNLNTSHVKVKP